MIGVDNVTVTDPFDDDGFGSDEFIVDGEF